MARRPRLVVPLPDGRRKRRQEMYRFTPEQVELILDWHKAQEILERRLKNRETWRRCAAVARRAGAELRRQKREPAIKAAAARRKAGRAPKNAIPGWQALLGRMEPGEWYAVADMADLLPEYRRSSAKFWAHTRLRQAGWIERTVNPGWIDAAQDRFDARQTPRYLYRLTDKAIGRREAWRAADRHLGILDLL